LSLPPQVLCLLLSRVPHSFHHPRFCQLFKIWWITNCEVRHYVIFSNLLLLPSVYVQVRETSDLTPLVCVLLSKCEISITAIHFNIIIPSTCLSFKLSLCFRLSNQCVACVQPTEICVYRLLVYLMTLYQPTWL
jgi:hypothetical protein